MNTSKLFDWIVIGGGVSGISAAEILSREGKSVLLIEKNSKLASETSKVFHEWMHSGTLYSLTYDNLLTLRYLLGATDDLLEYYSGFPRMNLVPTEAGLLISDAGWFNKDRIEYKYTIRKLNPIWMAFVSRSIDLVNMISNHDWLRRRAGSEYGSSKINLKNWVNNIPQQIIHKSKFLSKISPDITMNSRILISDLVLSAQANGLSITTEFEVETISESDDTVTVSSGKKAYHGNNVVICSPDAVSKFSNLPIKVSYAPIAIVRGVPDDANSFVELDYNIKKCINLLKKGDGIGQAGGITVNKEKDIYGYLDYVMSEHKKRIPSISVVDSYVGLKKELVRKDENRNYLYHITRSSNRVWSVVLGKFTLAFSMAPEFYRRVYHKNPSRQIPKLETVKDNQLIDKTSWQEIIEDN